MLNVILNIIVLGVFTLWFHKLLFAGKLILPAILFFLLAEIVVFFTSLAVQMDYLDGLLYLISAGLTTILFWLTAVIFILVRNQKNKTLTDLLQACILLAVPVIIWSMLSGASFKIGG